MNTIHAHNKYGRGHQRPDTIIVHSMGEFLSNDDVNYIYAPEYLELTKVSAHVIVAPNGDVYRCRADEEIAWHAGSGFNTDSLGIEFMVPGKYSWATRENFYTAISKAYLSDEQYQSGVDVCKAWVDKWGIKSVKRHSDVAPDRKKDPGSGFPWEQFLIDIGVST